MARDTAWAVEEWRAGWKLVLAAAIGFSFFSVMTSVTGLFMDPLGKEFGWSRAMQSSGLSIAALPTLLLSPFFGMAIDRWGSRRLALPGLVLTMGAIAAISQANGSQTQWIVLWLSYGLISLSVKSTVWTTAVAGVFDKGRGLALGMTLSGTALAQVITPPVVNWLIETQGWRLAMLFTGLAWGTIAFVLCWLFLYDAHDRRRAAPADAPVLPPLTGLSIPQALRDTALWRIALSTFIMMVLTIGLNAHTFPILTEAGVTKANAAWLMSLFGVAGIIGKLVTGYLLDRYAPNWVGGITLGITAFAFFFLLEGVRSVPAIVFAVVANGYAAGTKLQIAGLLTTRYGGLKNFGAIFGVMAALIGLGSAIGQVGTGKLYDIYGDYTVFLIIGVIGSLLSGLLVLSLPKYPDWGGAAASP